MSGSSIRTRLKERAGKFKTSFQKGSRKFKETLSDSEEYTSPNDLKDIPVVFIGDHSFTNQEIVNNFAPPGRSEETLILLKKVFQNKYPITRHRGIPRVPVPLEDNLLLIEALNNYFSTLRGEIIDLKRKKGDSVILREKIEHLQKIGILIDHFTKDKETFPYHDFEKYLSNQEYVDSIGDIDQGLRLVKGQQDEEERVRNLLRQFIKVYLQNKRLKDFDVHDPGVFPEQFKTFRTNYDGKIPQVLIYLMEILEGEKLLSPSKSEYDFTKIYNTLEKLRDKFATAEIEKQPEFPSSVLAEGGAIPVVDTSKSLVEETIQEVVDYMIEEYIKLKSAYDTELLNGLDKEQQITFYKDKINNVKTLSTKQGILLKSLKEDCNKRSRELDQWKVALTDRDRLLTEAYDAVGEWKRTVEERDTLLNQRNQLLSEAYDDKVRYGNEWKEQVEIRDKLLSEAKKVIDGAQTEYPGVYEYGKAWEDAYNRLVIEQLNQSGKTNPTVAELLSEVEKKQYIEKPRVVYGEESKKPHGEPSNRNLNEERERREKSQENNNDRSTVWNGDDFNSERSENYYKPETQENLRKIQQQQQENNSKINSTIRRMFNSNAEEEPNRPIPEEPEKPNTPTPERVIPEKPNIPTPEEPTEWIKANVRGDGSCFYRAIHRSALNYYEGSLVDDIYKCFGITNNDLSEDTFVIEIRKSLGNKIKNGIYDTMVETQKRNIESNISIETNAGRRNQNELTKGLYEKIREAAEKKISQNNDGILWYDAIMDELTEEIQTKFEFKPEVFLETSKQDFYNFLGDIVIDRRTYASDYDMSIVGFILIKCGTPILLNIYKENIKGSKLFRKKNNIKVLNVQRINENHYNSWYEKKMSPASFDEALRELKLNGIVPLTKKIITERYNEYISKNDINPVERKRMSDAYKVLSKLSDEQLQKFLIIKGGSKEEKLLEYSRKVANNRLQNFLSKEPLPFYTLIEEFENASNLKVVEHGNEKFIFESFLNYMFEQNFKSDEGKQFYFEAYEILNKKEHYDISKLCFTLLENLNAIQESKHTIDTVRMSVTEYNKLFDTFEQTIKSANYDFFSEASKLVPNKTSIKFFEDHIYFHNNTNSFEKTFRINESLDIDKENYTFNEELYYINNSVVYLFFIISSYLYMKPDLKLVLEDSINKFSRRMKRTKNKKTKSIQALLKDRKEFNNELDGERTS